MTVRSAPVSNLPRNLPLFALLTGCVTMTSATAAGGVNWRSKAGTVNPPTPAKGAHKLKESLPRGQYRKGHHQISGTFVRRGLRRPCRGPRPAPSRARHIRQQNGAAIPVVGARTPDVRPSIQLQRYQE